MDCTTRLVTDFCSARHWLKMSFQGKHMQRVPHSLICVHPPTPTRPVLPCSLTHPAPRSWFTHFLKTHPESSFRCQGWKKRENPNHSSFLLPQLWSPWSMFYIKPIISHFLFQRALWKTLHWSAEFEYLYQMQKQNKPNLTWDLTHLTFFF